MAAIFQLVYISEAAEDISYTDIREILEVSKRKNAAQNITGVLLFRDSFFLQVLEGEEKVVKELLSQIQKDDRNYSLKVLAEFEGTRRMFPAWSMAFHDADISSALTPLLDQLFAICMGPGQIQSKDQIVMMLEKFKASAPELR